MGYIWTSKMNKELREFNEKYNVVSKEEANKILCDARNKHGCDKATVTSSLKEYFNK